MTYIMLGVFWIGFFLIRLRPEELKDRVRSAYGHFKDGRKDSKLKSYIGKIREGILKEKQCAELEQSLSYIKNVAVLGKSKSIGVMTLLDGLIDISSLLKPAYRKMARLLSVNDKEAAGTALEELMGKGIGADVGGFIASWEDIEPKSILQTIEAYRSALREERTTKQKAKDEMISDIIYFPVVMNSMLVLLNFIYVAYFVPQQEALSVLF